jgi:hypothetical protein
MGQFDDEYIKDLIYSRKRRKKYKKIESLLKSWYGDKAGKQEISSYLPKPIHIKDTLDAVLSNAVGPREYKLIDLKKNWDILMGKDVGKNSEPVSIKNKILSIEVKNSIWLMQLNNFYKEMVEKKVKSFCGNDFCNRISFVPAGKSRKGKH